MASYHSADADTAGHSLNAGSSVGEFVEPNTTYLHPSSLPPPLTSDNGEGLSPVVYTEEQDEYWNTSVTYYETTLEILRNIISGIIFSGNF